MLFRALMLALRDSDIEVEFTPSRPSTYKKLNDGAKLVVIASRKRRGDVTKVADRTGYSVSHVSRVLNSFRQNKRILNKAYDMTRGRVKNSLK